MHNNLSIANEENNLDMLGNPTFTGVNNNDNVNEIENNLEIENCNDMFSFLFNNNKRINKTNRTPDKLQNRSLSNLNTIINNFYNYFISNYTKNNFNTNEKEIWKKYIGDLITQKNNVLSSSTVENNVINLIKYHSNNNDTASVNQLTTLLKTVYSKMKLVKN